MHQEVQTENSQQNFARPPKEYLLFIYTTTAQVPNPISYLFI